MFWFPILRSCSGRKLCGIKRVSHTFVDKSCSRDVVDQSQQLLPLLARKWQGPVNLESPAFNVAVYGKVRCFNLRAVGPNQSPSHASRNDCRPNSLEFPSFQIDSLRSHILQNWQLQFE